MTSEAQESLNPQDFVCGVNKLRGTLSLSGAAAVVVCQVKPMELGDVSPYNELLSDYLRGQRGGFGCSTQIRLGHLRSDGYHVNPQFDSIIDKTYACAIRGIPVHDPTPRGAFVPMFMRRRYETEWPRLGGGVGLRANNGW